MTDSDLLVLHTLRCVGATTLEALADAAGLSETDTQTELIDLAVDGLVTRDTGAFGGWRITAEGRAAGTERIAAELDGCGARDAVKASYDSFLQLNPKLLDICTDWQTKTLRGSMNMNDHNDPAYDGRVLDRLDELHRRAEVVCADLSAALRRFARYPIRLSAALERANAGEIAYVADNTASYHSVWFQLHQDLLVTLGIPRESDA